MPFFSGLLLGDWRGLVSSLVAVKAGSFPIRGWVNSPMEASI
jgi:hypothetical protein